MGEHSAAYIRAPVGEAPSGRNRSPIALKSHGLDREYSRWQIALFSLRMRGRMFRRIDGRHDDEPRGLNRFVRSVRCKPLALDLELVASL